MPYLGVTPAAEFTSKDLNGEELILDADADTTITADTDDTIDIRIAGADDFQFTANTFTAQAGSTIAAQALTATTITTTANPTFANTANNLEVSLDSTYSTILDAQVGNGEFFVLGTNKSFRFDTSSGSGKMNLAAEGFLSLNENENSDMTTGLTINQGASDDEIFALKSSDVAHGMTDLTETDTYAAFTKSTYSTGGLAIVGFSEASDSFTIVPRATTEFTADTTAARASMTAYCQLKDGTTIGAMGDTANMAAITNHSLTRWLIKGNGDVHQTTDAHTALDSFADADLCRAFDLEMADPASIIKDKWDEFLTDRKETLIKAGILPRMTQEQLEAGDKPLFNSSQLQRLHNGAISQMSSQIKDMAEELSDIKQQVGLLPAVKRFFLGSDKR